MTLVTCCRIGPHLIMAVLAVLATSTVLAVLTVLPVLMSLFNYLLTILSGVVPATIKVSATVATARHLEKVPTR